MTLFTRLATIGLLAVASAAPALGQEFGHLFNRASQPQPIAKKPVVKGVYAHVSDDGKDSQTHTVAFESLSDLNPSQRKSGVTISFSDLLEQETPPASEKVADASKPVVKVTSDEAVDLLIDENDIPSADEIDFTLPGEPISVAELPATASKALTKSVRVSPPTAKTTVPQPTQLQLSISSAPAETTSETLTMPVGTSGTSVTPIMPEPTPMMSALPTEVMDGGVSESTIVGSAFDLSGDVHYELSEDCGVPSIGAACGLPAEPACGAAACDDCACATPCTTSCVPCPTCCGVGMHCTHVYGDALYLRARKAEVAYAVPIDGPIVPGQAPIQVGNVGILDSDYDMGFRAGMNIALDTVSSLDVRYTLFESLTENEISTTAPLALRSLVTHPSSASAAQDGLAATASLEIDYDVIDVAYRHLLKCGDVFSANYVVGARYAKLEQQFDAEFLKLGTETVATDIDFDGAGMRLGLETQRFSCRNQLHVYANGYASFLAGRFRARYFQGQSFDPSVVDAEWEAGRIVPILDFEAGVGWCSPHGKLRLNAGYMVSGWFNTVLTQDYIDAIQNNNYLELSDSMWFDGLQARISFNF